MITLQFWIDQRDRTQARITAYQDAIDYLIENPTKSYKLNTGQSEQEVTRVDLEKLENLVERSMNRLITLNQYINPSPSVHAPAW